MSQLRLVAFIESLQILINEWIKIQLIQQVHIECLGARHCLGTENMVVWKCYREVSPGNRLGGSDGHAAGLLGSALRSVSSRGRGLQQEWAEGEVELWCS